MKTEFEFIQYIKKSFGLRAVGDDCAVLPKDDSTDMLVTADLLIEDIDFQLDWTTPEFLGHKALAVSLSDVAAMGGEPRWAMLTLGVPADLWNSDFLQRFYAGWHELGNRYGVELVGGDISRSPDKLVFDSIVAGEVPNGAAILRSGAQPGNAIYVTGPLGGAACGLELLVGEDRIATTVNSPHERLIRRLLRPDPKVEVGRFLRKNTIATAMIDISDGLSSDLHHICEASGVGARIDASLMPIDPDIRDLRDANEQLALALNGGEDFELLFTVPEERTSLLGNQSVTRIGTITENAEVVELIDGEKVVNLQPSGYRHF
jgi:thiamine-monophosphate kinase